MKVLFVDNFDSFTYNIVHLLAEQGVTPDVMHNDDPRLDEKLLEGYDALVVGPGPGNPSQTPQVTELIRAAAKKKMPIFGVCLGLQAIGEAFGARTTHAPKPLHGKVSSITVKSGKLFEGIASPLEATRYHSLCLDPNSLPEELEVTATSADGVIQGIAHKTLPISAVQFHPESVLSEDGEQIVRNALGLDR
ncbi:MAG TPA: aminodeoxychorismate/anthranilate synthase component II [Candidatus Rubrimentiphilum sp.]|nr:aminodeoxychorismate/anthranilate synthase component II [Candidatus Rubrimentiphilum sp.]